MALPLMLVAVACVTTPSPVLVVENGTDLDVTVVLNGNEVAVIGVDEVAEIDFGELPRLPWSVDARSPSGRVLTTMEVRPGDVTHTTQGNVEESSSTMGRVDLSCGRLTIWAGYLPPSGPAPMPNAGEAGDCEP